MRARAGWPPLGVSVSGAAHLQSVSDLGIVWHSIALAAIVGLIVLMYAYVFPGAAPHGLKLHI